MSTIKCYSDISCKQVDHSSGSSIYTVIGVIAFNHSSTPLFQSYHRIREDRIKCLNSTYSELQGINYCLTRLFQIIDNPSNVPIRVSLYCDNVSAVSVANRSIDLKTPMSSNPFNVRSASVAKRLSLYIDIKLSIDEMIYSLKSLNYHTTIIRISRNQNPAHQISRQGMINCYLKDAERRKQGLEIINTVVSYDKSSQVSERNLIQSAYEKHSKPEDIWHFKRRIARRSLK